MLKKKWTALKVWDSLAMSSQNNDYCFIFTVKGNDTFQFEFCENKDSLFSYLHSWNPLKSLYAPLFKNTGVRYLLGLFHFEVCTFLSHLRNFVPV